MSLLVASILIVAAALLAVSCGTPSFSKETRTRLSESLDKVLRENDMPGAVAIVSVEGKGSWVATKGKGDLATGEPMEVSDKFRIASITKTFTAEMVLMLADQGKLKLEDTVDKYVNEVPNGNKITVRMLLNHTSGIMDEDPEGILRRETKDDPLKQWRPWDVFQAFTGGKVQGEPGKEHVYSNAGYVLLGIIIEKVSGKTVQQFLEEQITGPLAMHDTYFPDGPDITGPHAHGYDGQKDVTRMNMSWDFTAGAMISTVNDLNTWARAFAEGKLISPEMHKQQLIWVDVPGGRGQIKYGLGMENLFGWLGHNGSNTGWQSDMYYLPDEKATVVVLMNKESSDGSDGLAAQQAFAGPADIVVPGSIPDWYLESISP